MNAQGRLQTLAGYMERPSVLKPYTLPHVDLNRRVYRSAWCLIVRFHVDVLERP